MIITDLPDSYVWHQDMRMLSAAETVFMGAPSDRDGDTGFKPRPDEEPAWVLPIAVLIMLVVIAVAAAVIIGSMKAT